MSVAVFYFGCGIFWSWCLIDSPGNGAFPVSQLPPAIQNALTGFRRLTHDPPMCPLCGGTRSFLYMCRGDIVSAAHYSLFGTFFFLLCLIQLPVKLWLLKTSRLPGKSLQKTLHVIDNGWLFPGLVLVLWIIQLALHFTGIFQWATLA